MGNIQFNDFSFDVIEELNDETVAWLLEWSNEIASHAKRNCQMDDDRQLSGSYRADVDDKEGKATIGTSLESGYWEEFGTGEYADTSKNGGKQGRQGWWVYIEGGSGHEGETNVYATKEEAERMAAYIQEKYKLKAIATNGLQPNYTLEKAFNANRKKAERNLAERLKNLEK